MAKVIQAEWQSKRVFKRANLLLVATASLICIGGAFKIGKEKLIKPTQAKISLAYQSASNGLNPNGTRFNPYLMISDDTIKTAEKQLGYNIDKLKIWVGLPEKSSSDSTATDYYLYYSGKNGEEVLKAVLTAWDEMFASKYTESTKSVMYEAPDGDSDYIYIANWLEEETSQIASYANTRLKKDNTWTSEDGTSYQSIYDETQTILDTDIENLKTYIIQNGISKDPDSLKQTVAYKDRLLSMKKDNYDSQYKNRRDAITLYDPTLFPTISVPSISSGTYYITTTKTGLDYIYDAASVASSNSVDVQRQLSDDKQLVANMSGPMTEDQKETVEAMCDDIEEKIKDLGKKLENTDKEYKETQEEPYYRITVNGSSFVPGKEEK